MTVDKVLPLVNVADITKQYHLIAIHHNDINVNKYNLMRQQRQKLHTNCCQ